MKTFFSYRRGTRALFVAALLTQLATGGCAGTLRSTAPVGSPEWIEQTKKELEAKAKRPNTRVASLRALANLDWAYLQDRNGAKKRWQRLVKSDDDRIAHWSLMLMAVAEDDLDATWEHATKLIVSAGQKGAIGRTEILGRPQDVLAQDAAEAIVAIYGRRPQDEVDFERFVASLPLSKLPVEVRQPLTSRLARNERLENRDYRAIYDQQGCLREFDVSAMIGSLGAWDLARMSPADKFVADPMAPVARLSCAARVWNPLPDPGYRRIRTLLEIPSGQALIELSASGSLRAYLDGVPLVDETQLSHMPSSSYMLEIKTKPGAHLLELGLTVQDERAWFLARATDEKGTPLAQSRPTAAILKQHAVGGDKPTFGKVSDGCSALAGTLPHELDRVSIELCNARQALAQGDGELARAAKHRLEARGDFPEAHWLIGEIEQTDRNLSAEDRADKSRLSFQRALDLEPALDMVQLSALRLSLQKNEPAVVRKEFEAASSVLKPSTASLLFGHHLALSLGDLWTAARRLQGAQERSSSDCDVLESARAFADYNGELALEDTYLEKLANCAGQAERRAKADARRGEMADAKLQWQALISRTPDNLDAHLALAEIAQGVQDWDVAVSHYREVLRYAPYRGQALLGLAQSEWARGRSTAAAEVLGKALELRPADQATWRVAREFGIVDPLLDMRVDGTEIFRAYQAGLAAQSESADDSGEGANMVLDRDVLWINSDGSHRHLVHQIVRVASKDAIDRYGEASFPGSSELLTLRTVKPDGRIVDPEAVAGKESWSLRELEIGDYVETEFIAPGERVGPGSGRLDGGAFRFQSPAEPYYRSEFVISYPIGMPVKIEERNSPPHPEILERGGRREVSYVAREMPRLELEPNLGDELDVLPAVTIFANLDLEAHAQTVAAALRESFRADQQLIQTARRIVSPAKTSREKAERIWDFCRNNIDPDGGLQVPARLALSQKRGNLASLFVALATAAGLDVEVWLARSRYAASLKPGGNPLIDTYTEPVVRIALPAAEGGEIFHAAESRYMPLGYLSPGLRDTQAVRLPLHPNTQTGSVGMIPSGPEHPDRREYDLSIRYDESGGGVLEGSIKLFGIDALQWRSGLEELEPSRLRQAFQVAEIGQWRGASNFELVSLDVENQTELAKPLVLKFAAKFRDLATFSAGVVSLPLVVVPGDHFASFAGVPTRHFDLVIPYDPYVEVAMRVDLGHATVGALPAQVNIDKPWGRYVRSATADGEHAFTVTMRSQLRRGVVAAQDYGKFLELAQEVRRVEDARLTAQP